MNATESTIVNCLLCERLFKSLLCEGRDTNQVNYVLTEKISALPDNTKNHIVNHRANSTKGKYEAVKIFGVPA